MEFFDYANPLQIYTGNLPHWRQAGVPYFVTFRLADSIPQVKLREWAFERHNWFRIHREPYTQAELEEFHFLFSERVQAWLDAGHGKCVLRNPGVAGIVESALRQFDGLRYDLDEFVVMPNHVHVIVMPRALGAEESGGSVSVPHPESEPCGAGPERSGHSVGALPGRRVAPKCMHEGGDAPAALGDGRGLWSAESGGGGSPPHPGRDAPATLGGGEGYVLEKILHTWKSYTAHEINRLLHRRGQLWQAESYDHLVRSERQLVALRKYIRGNPERKGSAALDR